MQGSNYNNSKLMHNIFINNPEWRYGVVKESVEKSVTTQEFEGFLKLHNGSYKEFVDIHPEYLGERDKDIYVNLKKAFSGELGNLVLTKFDIQAETGHHIAFELYSLENDFHNYITFHDGGNFENPSNPLWQEWGVRDFSMQGSDTDYVKSTQLTLENDKAYEEFFTIAQNTLHNDASAVETLA